MYSRPLGQNIIYLCLKREHLCSDLRPTATKGPISAVEKSNRKRTVGEHLSTIWMSENAQAVKHTWAKQSLLISITHHDTFKIMHYISFHASHYNIFRWSKLRSFSDMQPCGSYNVLFAEPFKDFQVFSKLISSRSAKPSQWGMHKQLDSEGPRFQSSSWKASPWWDCHRCLHDCCLFSVHEQSFTKPAFSSQEPVPDNTAQNPLHALKHSPRRMAGELKNMIPFQSFEPRLFFLATTAVIIWKYHSVIRAAKWMDQ